MEHMIILISSEIHEKIGELCCHEDMFARPVVRVFHNMIVLAESLPRSPGSTGNHSTERPCFVCHRVPR